MTDQWTPKDYLEFSEEHLVALKRYVVIIAHKDRQGRECVGSGVSVKMDGRHFIATARHCIEHSPEVVPDNVSWFINGRFHVERPLRILNRGWHDTLDVGFLELEKACDRELQESQLSFETIVGGSAYVIGHPVCRFQKVPQRMELHIDRCCIGITPLEQTADVCKYNYMLEGVRQMAENDW